MLPTSGSVATYPTGVSDMSSLQNPRAKSNANEKTKALRATIDDSVELLAKAVDEVRASDMFRRFLDTQAKFHRYS